MTLTLKAISRYLNERNVPTRQPAYEHKVYEHRVIAFTSVYPGSKRHNHFYIEQTRQQIKLFFYNAKLIIANPNLFFDNTKPTKPIKIWDIANPNLLSELLNTINTLTQYSTNYR